MVNYQIGCLVIHGFGGDTKEVAPLASYLIDQGYKVLSPHLKGHTGRREDLKGVSYSEWIVSAEEDLLSLLAECKEAYIIGFSMGGLIAINLGLKHPIRGIVTINTPIYYLNIKKSFMNIVNLLIKNDFETLSRYVKRSRALSFSSFLEFRLLVKTTKPQIKDLRCPIFVAQAIDDPTVKKNSANYIFENTGSSIKRLEFYPSSEHLILLSKEADLVTKDTIEFIREIT